MTFVWMAKNEWAGALESLMLPLKNLSSSQQKRFIWKDFFELRVWFFATFESSEVRHLQKLIYCVSEVANDIMEAPHL